MSHLPIKKELLTSDTEILTFLIARAGIYAFNARDLKTMAHRCNIRADNLSRFIRDGKFSVAAAEEIEKICGREYVRWEWLVNPVTCMKNGEIE